MNWPIPRQSSCLIPAVDETGAKLAISAVCRLLERWAMATTRSRTTKKRSASSAVARKRTTKRPTRRKVTARTAVASKKAPARKKKRTTKRYGSAASKKVRGALRELERGELRSGRSKKKVQSRKQAVAIGLSRARRAGGKVPRRSTAR